MTSNFAQKRFMVIDMSRGQIEHFDAAPTAPTWILSTTTMQLSTIPPETLHLLSCNVSFSHSMSEP